MMKKWMFLLLTLFFSELVYADDLPYPITVIRNHVAHQRVAAPSWQGEYPAPVIDVRSKFKGNTQVIGYPSLRNKKESKVCTIANGLYHPWSTTANSVKQYYTLVALEDYQVLQTPTQTILEQFDDIPADRIITAGDEIVNVVYWSEGGAIGTLRQPNHTDVAVGFRDFVFKENPEYFRQTQYIDTMKSEQWLYLSCTEGYDVFVQDTELLKQPKIKTGNILEYGKIAAQE